MNLTLFDLIIGNMVFQIELETVFVNIGCSKLEQIVYDQLIKNKQRCCYKSKTVLLFLVYRIMKVKDEAAGVVSTHYWLCIASLMVNRSNDGTRGRPLEQRSCIMLDVLVQNVLTD